MYIIINVIRWDHEQMEGGTVGFLLYKQYQSTPKSLQDQDSYELTTSQQTEQYV